MNNLDTVFASDSCKHLQEKHLRVELSETTGRFEAAIEEKEAEFEYLRNKGKLVARELDLFRQRRIVQWMDRFRNRVDAWNIMDSCFQQLKDDCVIFNGHLKGFILQPSITLNRVPFLSYDIFVDRPNLSAILLALIIDFPSTSGEIGIQIVSRDNLLLAEAMHPIAQVRDEHPTVFQFSSIADSNERMLKLKIFIHGADLPVRLFEMRRYTLFGLGSIETRAFCGFQFN